jgi:hypothetical protein
MRLALGTLALENTEQAITPEQAAELLPLWKAANSLSGADNIATEETQGLFGQIEDAMTPEQMQAIQGMDFSGENMAELASTYGFQMGGGRRGELSEEMRATMEAAQASGQMPEGFTPGMAPPEGAEFRLEGGGADGPIPGEGGQGFFMRGAEGNSAASGNAAGGTVSNPLYDAVIALLEKKIE